ncbi:MAG: hypothetical protein HY300_11155 [Verrucomicrobia bacterium]|nr:hypothetical protein [Verrucomicrobiota bacterium]
MNLTTSKPILALALAGLCAAARADERLFTYTYEPETAVKGAWEYENWVTLRKQRSTAVGQQNFTRWEFRQELEYGVTDNYEASIYFNTFHEGFTDPATGTRTSNFTFDGISMEHRYQVLNAAEHPVGLTLYLEPRFSGKEFELEQKILVGQRHGKWKWAANLTHATEWGDHFRTTEGEVEVSLGLSRLIGKHWALGIELRDHNELPEYKKWENTALYIGPVVSYRAEKWWATLTVMPQIYGANFTTPDPDGNRRLELEGHERWNVRLIFGINF